MQVDQDNSNKPMRTTSSKNKASKNRSANNSYREPPQTSRDHHYNDSKQQQDDYSSAPWTSDYGEQQFAAVDQSHVYNADGSNSSNWHSANNSGNENNNNSAFFDYHDQDPNYNYMQEEHSAEEWKGQNDHESGLRYGSSLKRSREEEEYPVKMKMPVR